MDVYVALPTELHRPVPASGLEPETSRSVCDNPFTVGPKGQKGAMDVLGALPTELHRHKKTARRTGFEPATSRLEIDNPSQIGPVRQVAEKDVFGALPTELPSSLPQRLDSNQEPFD